MPRPPHIIKIFGESGSPCLFVITCLMMAAGVAYRQVRWVWPSPLPVLKSLICPGGGLAAMSAGAGSVAYGTPLIGMPNAPEHIAPTTYLGTTTHGRSRPHSLVCTAFTSVAFPSWAT